MLLPLYFWRTWVPLIVQKQIPRLRRAQMEHFSEQVWADYVRGIGQTNTSQEIEAHLANACPDCTPVCGMWRKVYAIAANEASLAPPEGVVRVVKLEMAARQVRPARGLWPDWCSTA